MKHPVERDMLLLSFFLAKMRLLFRILAMTRCYREKNLSRFLTLGRLAQPIIDEIEKSVTIEASIPLRYTISGIVRAVKFKHIMGIHQLPGNTYEIMEAYRYDVKRWAAFPFPELLNYMPSLRKKRDFYDVFTKDI